MAWLSSRCKSLRRFFRLGRYGRDNASNHTDRRNERGAEDGHASSTPTKSVGFVEAGGTRLPSWMQVETRPHTITTTKGKSGSAGGAFRSAIETSGIRKPSWAKPKAMPATTDGPSDLTDGTCDLSDGSDDRKPSWMQPETMPATTDDIYGESDRVAERAARKAKDLKPDSLLAQRHIVALLFMEAVYSVSLATGVLQLRGGGSEYVSAQMYLTTDDAIYLRIELPTLLNSRATNIGGT